MSRRLGGHVDAVDLHAYGHAVLLDATRAYDPSRSQFARYIARRIKWAMLDGLRQTRTTRRITGRALAIAASERFGETVNAQVATAEGPATEELHEQRLQGLLEGHAAALATGLLSVPIDIADASETPEDQTARAEIAEALREAVLRLPERERILIERHYYNGDAFEVIARELGVSKSWASRLHAQAIQSLAAALRAPSS
jgi:RNA polymerase sigma factor for flagellar operon FliA